LMDTTFTVSSSPTRMFAKLKRLKMGVDVVEVRRRKKKKKGERRGQQMTRQGAVALSDGVEGRSSHGIQHIRTHLCM
jgi:hypothetical protein